MKRITFLGDLHCDQNYKPLFLPNCVQLGDLCLLGYNGWSFPEGDKRYLPGKRFFLDGNHDRLDKLNPDAPEPYSVAENLIYIPRGYVDGKVLFIGGADSIPPDRALRTPGIDWFDTEAISQQQFERIMSIGKEIEVIVSHSCPLFVASEMFMNKFGVSSVFKLPSEITFNAIFKKLKPKLWVYGHLHKHFDKVIKDCRFICLNIAEHIELLVPTEKIGEDPQKKYDMLEN